MRVSPLRSRIGQAALAALLWLVMATLAAAHASLTGAQPADGAMLAAAPAAMTLSFSEPVSPLVLTLVRPDGTQTDLTAAAGGDTLSIAMPPGLGRGTHRLAWRVVSADGHPVGGALAFSIGAESPMPLLAAEDGGGTVEAGLWATRLALYAAIVFGIGGAFALVRFPGGERPGRRLVLALLGLGCLAAGLAAGFQGLDALRAPLSGLANPLVWQASFDTSFSRSLGLVAIAFVLAAFGLLLKSRRSGLLLSGLAIPAVAAGLAATGHAGAASPQWLTRPAVFLHAATVTLWLGALPPLALALYRGHAGAGKALRRFSGAIPAILVVLLVSGAVLSAVQVQRPAGLIHSDYGRLLLAKLALVAAVLVLAAWNRWRLTRPVLEGAPCAAKGLVRSIAVETLLLLAILGIAAGWRFTPPPRALAIAAMEPVALHSHTGEAMADATVTPGEDGRATVSVVLMSGDFGPLDARTVSFVLTRPDRRAAAIRVEASRPGDGSWSARGLDLAPAGNWRLRIEIATPDGRRLALDAPFDLPPSPFR